MKRVMFRNHSIYTRALLAESILHSQMNHNLITIQLSPKRLVNIQKIMNKMLWRKNRTRGPIKVEGLNMRDTILKAECLHADSGVRHLRRYYEETALKLIEGYLQELLTDNLLTMVSQRMETLRKKQTYLTPIYTDTILKMAAIIKTCEENQDTWEASAIRGSVYDQPFPITKKENQILKDRGLTTVSQLFDTEEPRSLDRQGAVILTQKPADQNRQNCNKY